MITRLLDDDFVDDYLINADFKLENLEYYELILSVQGKMMIEAVRLRFKVSLII